MAETGTQGGGDSGTVQLTWVDDDLAHVLDRQADEGVATWTGLACPDHGLQIGGDVDITTLLRLAGQGAIADLTWEVPGDFAKEHEQLCAAAIQAHLSGRRLKGERLWEQAMALWSQAWSANNQVLQLMQESGVAEFSPARPQRWLIASFAHHAGPHGLQYPHVHNIVIPALTTAAHG